MKQFVGLLVVAATVVTTVHSTVTEVNSVRLSGPLRNWQFYKGKLYVGGTDYIYSLTMDLTVNTSVNTCNESVRNCGNVNQLLLVSNFTDELISCGTGSNGVCQKCNLDNIGDVVTSSSSDNNMENYLQVSSDQDRQAVGLITSNGNLMIAVTVGEGVYSYSLEQTRQGYKTYDYAISTRILTDFERYTGKNEFKSLNFEVHVTDDQVYIVYYKGNFQHNDSSYFLTNQPDIVGSSVYVSKLASLCQNDKDYRSYADIELTCKSEAGVKYNLIQSATIIEPPPNFNLSSSERIFVGVFMKGEDPEHPSGDSVICIEKMSEIEKRIFKAKTDYLTCQSKNYTEEKRYLKSYERINCLNQSTDFHISDVVCAEGFYVRLNIIGTEPLEMQSRHIVQSEYGKAATIHGTVFDETEAVIFVGTNKGYILKMNLQMNLDSALSVTRYDEQHEGLTNIQAIHQENDETLFVMDESMIKRYKSTSCTEYRNCTSTMKGRNPLCGWCIFQDRATRRQDCPEAEWLHSSKQCIFLTTDIEGVRAGNTGNEYVMITAENLPNRNDPSDNYTCRFTGSQIPSGRIDAKNVSGNFSCRIPPVSSHTQATLELLVNDTSLASVSFLFYSCDSYKRCGQCVNTSGADCTWDLAGPKCKDHFDASASGINDLSQCPRLENNTDSGMVFIPVGVNSQVKLKGSNLPNASMHYWCYVPKNGQGIDDDVYKDADLSSSNDEIICSLKITPSNSSRKHNVRVFIKYSSTDEFNKDLPALDDEYNNTVIVYRCELLANECGSCTALNKTRYSKCKWCNEKCLHNPSCTPVQHVCPAPTVTSVVPYDGPLAGGTSITIKGHEFGSQKEDIGDILVGSITCQKNVSRFVLLKNEDFDTAVPQKIVCKAQSAEGSNKEGVPLNVAVTVNGRKSVDTKSFTYKRVSVSGIKPLHGPISGGTVITIEGINLGVSSREWTVRFEGVDCSQAEVKPYIPLGLNNSANFRIECVIGDYSGNLKIGDNITQLVLEIDDQAVVHLEDRFQVLANPEIFDFGPKDSIMSGGLTITVTGSKMNNANKGEVKYKCGEKDMKEPCVIKSDKETHCKVPELCDQLKNDLRKNLDQNPTRQKRADCSGCVEITIVVKLDGIEKSFELKYFRDPSINQFGKDGETVLYKTDQQQLVLTGEHLNLVATKYDFNVTIGIANCTVIELTQDTLRCSPPNDQPAPVDPKSNFPEVKVQVGNWQEFVGYLEYEKKVELIAIIAGVASGGLLLIIVSIFVVGFIKYRKVGKKAREYEKNLSNMEMEIKRVAREEFLDMHTTMSSVNKNLVEQGFPYHSYQQFACNVMFSVDYLWTEPVVSNGKMTDDERLKANKGMESLESLIYNKFFLVSVISTMEKEKRFFIREKSNLAGNLCAVLMGKMDYLDEILKLLMTNLVQDSPAKKHKTLFRRCESITEKLLSNWVSLCLYPHIKSHSGSPLYLLYMATQKTMESGPIDAVTGDAKYTLSEEKLLKKWSSQEEGAEDLKFEAKTLTLNLVVDNGEEIFKCKVLDCDTISQVKNKCLNQIYVNYPSSQLPVGANDLALEWHEGFGGVLKLRDEDNTSKRDGHWMRRNTLAHYNVKDDSNMALIDPHSAEIVQQEDYVNLAQINMDGVCDGSMDSTEPLAPLTPHDEENPHELQHWHLVKEEEESSKQGKSAIAELYLNRLFTTKQSLMEYMRPLFDIILDQDRCPPPTKFLFDFLDELGERYKVDGDTIHAWKSHSYAIRVWASIMKMPNLLFDVSIPQYMDGNLDIIGQVFIESFSLSSQKFTKDSPSQKLIFHHEMNHYREKVKEFYKNVKVDDPNADEFRQYMAEVNRLQQQTSFNKVSALYRFYKQLKPYFEDILETLSTSKEASDLHLDRKLEQVIEIMEEEDDD